MSVTAAIHDETTKIPDYTRKIDSSDELLYECLRQVKSREREKEEQEPSWKDKLLQGMCHQRKKWLTLRSVISG